MKIIQINLEGAVRPRFSTILRVDAHGYCYPSKRAEEFIRSQSVDGQIYSTPYLGIEGLCTNFTTHTGGEIPKYHIRVKASNPLDPQNYLDDKSEWKSVELRVIDIME